MSDEIQISATNALGRIVLNRPQAINALSREMIAGITEALDGWAADPRIAAVLFTGSGAKGFCSGGDVRAARASVIAGRAEEADTYFAAEYRMNGQIAAYPKPLIALTHGIVMGGGIGIAGHCRFRLTQPGARFAMPEAAIGFFSDVGVNAILAKAPVNRALLFLMSGASVGAADAVGLGLADAIVGAERVPWLVDAITDAAGSSDPGRAVVALMEAESIEAGGTPFSEAADLLPSQAPASAADFVALVGATAGLEDYAAMLATRSPTALTAIFHSHLVARRLMDVGTTLEMDLRVARVMARLPDFAEGVRAVLVDKDQQPKWSPAALAGVDATPILGAIVGSR
jgi:enoyl-CoA hydratase